MKTYTEREKINHKKFEVAWPVYKELTNSSGIIICEILNDKYKEFADYRRKDREEFISESGFSSLVTKKWYQVKPFKIGKIVEFLLDYLKPKGYHWDDDAQDFHYPFSTAIPVNSDVLNGLIGYYTAYSWDTFRTNTFDKDYIQIFKVHIESQEKIFFHTEKKDFDSGTIRLTIGQVVIMNNVSGNRKVTSAFYIGDLSENALKVRKKFELAYLDKGGNHIASGLFLLERVTKKMYEQLIPESKTEPDFPKAKWKSLIKFLKGTQQIILPQKNN